MTQLVLVPTVEQELEDRLKLFRELPGDTSPKTASPSRLRQLGIYGGTSGIWFDKKPHPEALEWLWQRWSSTQPPYKP